jgi:hypothetical protein
MTTEQKIIRAKVGRLELAKQLGKPSRKSKCFALFPPPPASTMNSRRLRSSMGDFHPYALSA